MQVIRANGGRSNADCVDPVGKAVAFEFSVIDVPYTTVIMAYIRNRVFEGMSYAHVEVFSTSSGLGALRRRLSFPSPPAATNTTTSSSSAHAASPIYATETPLPPLIRQPQATPVTMAEKELHSALQQLHQTLQSRNYQQATTLLSKAKMALLQLNALIPQEKTPKKQLQAARETLELGAIISIRLKDTVSFTRYFQQLQPFYALPASSLPKDGSQASKVTGLYLLLLLSEGDYAGFHTLLETLEVAAAQEGKGLEDDQFIQYPIRLEQALMEGSYDRVWGETKSERVPSDEFGMFSDVSRPRTSRYTTRAVQSLFSAICMLTLLIRSSSAQSVRRSPLAASAHTPRFPSPTPSPCCSLTQKAASSPLRASPAGLSRTDGYTSLSRRTTTRARTSWSRAIRSSRTR